MSGWVRPRRGPSPNRYWGARGRRERPAAGISSKTRRHGHGHPRLGLVGRPKPSSPLRRIRVCEVSRLSPPSHRSHTTPACPCTLTQPGPYLRNKIGRPKQAAEAPARGSFGPRSPGPTRFAALSRPTPGTARPLGPGRPRRTPPAAPTARSSPWSIVTGTPVNARPPGPARNATTSATSEGSISCLTACGARITCSSTSSSGRPCTRAWSAICFSTSGVRT